MQKHRPLNLQDLAQGRAVKARAMLLCLMILIGGFGVASHVHAPSGIDLHKHQHQFVQIPHSEHQKFSDISLENLVAEDCDQFHINSWAALEASPGHTKAYFGREMGLVETFSSDSISPELFPPARAPPSIISLT